MWTSRKYTYKFKNANMICIIYHLHFYNSRCITLLKIRDESSHRSQREETNYTMPLDIKSLPV